MQRLICVVFLAIIAATTAINFGRIGGPATQAVDALHAVLVLVEREDITEGNIAIGSGSIVTRNKVLTCAHVVRAATGVSVGFYNARFESIRFRLSKAEYWLPLQGFNSQTFENDLAVLFFPTNSFPAANVIPVAITQPETGSAAFLASYGFTSPESKAPTQFPLLAAHTVATCTDIIKATPSHFCAGATAPAVVCPGDNGGGLYFGDGPARRLFGMPSLINLGCTVANGDTITLVGFTQLSSENIQRFLVSQNIIPSDAPVEPVEP